MTKTCLSCDVLAPPDARYCRHCGATLQRLGEAGGNVSPIAATVPLSGQNQTDEIIANAPGPPPASHTSEVSHEEMHNLLRRGAPTGELRDVEPDSAGEGQFVSARGGHRSAPQADALRADPARGNAPASFDPEETQITIPVRPLTSRNLPADAAAASVATRSNGNPHFNQTPQQVTLSPTGTLMPVSPAPATAAPRATAQPNERRAFRVWLGMALAAVSLIVIACVAAALWFGTRGFGRAADTPPPVEAARGEAAPVPTDDPKQLAEAKLIEADALVAAGNTSEAVARLREATVLDPANAEPHRRLARLLLAEGSRREAIEELRATTRLAPADAEAWRSLASAQFAEGLYRDAVESYRGLGEASPDALARDSVQLAYADTLRLAGRTNDARVIYRRLAETSSDMQVAAASRRQLGQPTPTPTNEETADTDNANTQAADAARIAAGATATPRSENANRPPDAPSATPTPPPTDAPSRASTGSPSDQYQRGVALWTTNRAAAVAEFRAAAGRGNSDASYYLGLSIVEGRDPRSLKRADLVAALVHFGRARRGKFRGQSVTYEEQLGRELDRRRTQPSQ
ncbi:MAG TPA: tetratricopeptide repeat protein [Pyrinomonadaceae bacterium]|jgi:tetratricopeptide (TPR) repeat protein